MGKISISDYKALLSSELVPSISKVLSSCDDTVRGTINMVTETCFMETGMSSASDVELIRNLFSGSVSLNESDVSGASIFAVISYLTMLKYSEIDGVSIPRVSTPFGFKGLEDMIATAYTHTNEYADGVLYSDSEDDEDEDDEDDVWYDFDLDEEEETISSTSDTGTLQMRESSLESYVSSGYYVNDVINVIVPSLNIIPVSSDCSDEDKVKVLRCFGTQLSLAVAKILDTYTCLFSSGYQLVRPEGVLTEEGILTIKGTSAVYDWSHEAVQLYSVLSSKIGLRCIDSDIFDINLVVNAFITGDTTRYCFSRKILEYVYGCVNDGGAYKVTPDTPSWDRFKKTHISPEIVSILERTVFLYLKNKGYLEDDGYKSKGAFEEVSSLLDYLYKQLTSCILAMEWRDIDTTGSGYSRELVGFKVRVCDTDRVIPLDKSVPEEIISTAFLNNIGDEGALLEPAMIVGKDTKAYSVVDIQHKFKPSIVDGEPLFAYTALRALRASGRGVSTWDNLILGKREDGTILTFGKEIDIHSHLGHLILAGSRSGKGVMTLNIIAGGIANRKPIFYIDGKPDMASLFRSKELSNGKMFCVNGGYNARHDANFNSCSPESFNWNKRLPAFMVNDSRLGSSYNNYEAIFYLRAVMFVLSLLYVRGNLESPDLLSKLGGEDGILIVIDEISAESRSINSILSNNGLLGSSFYASKTLREASEKNNKDRSGAPIVTEWGCYCTDLINSLNSTFDALNNWKNRGLLGKGNENWCSDMFVIGQELPDCVDAKDTYIATNDNKVHGLSGSVFLKCLLGLGYDGFFGYNESKPHYMATGGGNNPSDVSKAAYRLTGTARNFNFVSSLGLSTLSKILDPDKSSKGIADSAVYFKPFLILNSAEEDSSYVREFLGVCESNHLDVDTIKSIHTNSDGILEPSIGFVPYVQEQSQDGFDIKEVLRQSYDIANTLVKSYIPDYDGDCIDFIYDLRPEAMFTADALLNAYKGTSKGDCVAFYTDKFYGTGSISGNQGNTDYNSEVNLGDVDQDYPEMVEDEPLVSSPDAPIGVTPELVSDRFSRRMDFYNSQQEAEDKESSDRAKVLKMLNNILERRPEFRAVLTPERKRAFVDFVISNGGL